MVQYFSNFLATVFFGIEIIVFFTVCYFICRCVDISNKFKFLMFHFRDLLGSHLFLQFSLILCTIVVCQIFLFIPHTPNSNRFCLSLKILDQLVLPYFTVPLIISYIFLQYISVHNSLFVL